MKISTIVGARPQFIKAAVVSRAILSSTYNVQESIIHTGQHYDENMSSIFFDELDIPRPDINLGVSEGTHGQNTGRMLESIENVLLVEKPDCVLVYGDTNSTLAAAIAASKLNIPIAHVEAGLRSFNRRMPEEINRVLTDHVSKFLFSPTVSASENLFREGVSVDSVFEVGDVMYDAALYYRNKARAPKSYKNLTDFVLATIHRQENTDDPKRLKNIVQSLNTYANDKRIVLPLHPRTRKKLVLSGIDTKNLLLLDPVGYLEMIWLLKNCEFVVSDSGGLQKEAYFFGKRCVITRDETEWVELTENNHNILVNASFPFVLPDETFGAKVEPQQAADKGMFFGNGNAAGQIIKTLYDKV